MALIKKNDLKKMSPQEKSAKIKELQFELVMSQVTAKKASAKTKEIKRTVARLTTMMNSQMREAPK